MNYEQIKYWLALNSIPGIGNVVFSSLLDVYKSPEAVFSSSVSELQSIPGMTKKTATAIVVFKKWDTVKKEIEHLEKDKIKVVTCHDELYPRRLSDVYDRPSVLYVKGILKINDVNVSVVGSRLASTYGKYTTEKLSRELALSGITIVSGLARGIDSAAHQGALTANGRTIAVLGSGLDVIYPPENKKLFAAISENGAVISEYPPGTPPRAANFPARNRIISGMSYGVVVVEAGEKSGSLITARLAIEQGREVFAVPGSIDSAGSRGTNKLIKQGAKLIENIDDILEEISPQLEKPVMRKKNTASETTAPPAVKPDTKNDDMNAADRQIIRILSERPLHVDEIMNLTGIPPQNLLSTLLALELKGIIKQHPGKFFSLQK